MKIIKDESFHLPDEDAIVLTGKEINFIADALFLLRNSCTRTCLDFFDENFDMHLYFLEKSYAIQTLYEEFLHLRFLKNTASPEADRAGEVK